MPFDAFTMATPLPRNPIYLFGRQDSTTTSTTSTSTSTSTSPSTTPTTTSTTTSSSTIPTSTSTTSSTPTTTPTTSSTTTSSSTTSSSSSSTESSSSSTIPPPTTSSVLTTAPDGQTVTSVVVVTPTQSSTRNVGPSASAGSDNNASKGFFHNTAAVAGTFAAVGIVALVLFVVVVTTAIRRRRAKEWDREIAEAAREANVTGGLPDEYMDDNDGPGGGKGFYGAGTAGGYPGGGGGGGGYNEYAYPGPGGGGASMSEAGSHGTYGAYQQGPMGHSDGGEMYQMRDLGGSGAGPGGFYDGNGSNPAYATGLAAGAAGIGVARARSQHTTRSGTTDQQAPSQYSTGYNDPNGYYSTPVASPPYSQSSQSQTPGLERNLSGGSSYSYNQAHAPPSFAAAFGEGGSPYPAFLHPGALQQATTTGSRGIPQSVLDAAYPGGVGAATATSPSTTGTGPTSNPTSAATSTYNTNATSVLSGSASGSVENGGGGKESYAAHYERPIGASGQASSKQSGEGGEEDAYGGVGLGYDESHSGHGHGNKDANVNRTSSDSAHNLPNPFGRAMESESEEEGSDDEGKRKVLRVANE